jgi:hypothetical protein
MSVKTKYFSILMLGGMGIASMHASAMTTTNTDELYADSVKLERSSAEIPTSIDSETGNTANSGDEYVVDSMNELDAAQALSKPVKPEKKVSTKSMKSKKSSKN